MKRALQIKTLDLAKRLLDFGFHPPTVYFPLLVEEALMVEPTETETRETLDALRRGDRGDPREAAEDPEIARNAPYTTPVRRLRGEVAAAKPARSAAGSALWRRADLLRHPADRAQAPGQLHRRDHPVRLRPGARRGDLLHRRPARDHRRLRARRAARALLRHGGDPARRGTRSGALHAVPPERRVRAHRTDLAARERHRLRRPAADAPIQGQGAPAARAGVRRAVLLPGAAGRGRARLPRRRRCRSARTSASTSS